MAPITIYTFNNYFDVFSLSTETQSYNFNKGYTTVTNNGSSLTLEDSFNDLTLEILSLSSIDGETFASYAEMETFFNDYIAEYFPYISYPSGNILVQAPQLSFTYRNTVNNTSKERLVIDSDEIFIKHDGSGYKEFSITTSKTITNADAGAAFEILSLIGSEHNYIDSIQFSVVSNSLIYTGTLTLEYSGSDIIKDISSVLSKTTGQSEAFKITSDKLKSSAIYLRFPIAIISGSLELSIKFIYRKYYFNL